MSVLAIVPARGGSRGIPRKNLVEIQGRSLLAWSVRAGLLAQAVDRVLVSTDDDEIAAAGVAAGADVPFKRPAELAGDQTTDLPVFQHAVRWLARAEGYRPDIVVHLRPTSPARSEGLIDRAVAHLRAHHEATSLRSVSPATETPWKMWNIDGDYLSPVLGTMGQEAFNQPRQSLPPTWLNDGVIDVVRTEVIMGGSMTGPHVLAWRSTELEGVDIDLPGDLPRAEQALRLLGEDQAL